MACWSPNHWKLTIIIINLIITLKLPHEKNLKEVIREIFQDILNDEIKAEQKVKNDEILKIHKKSVVQVSMLLVILNLPRTVRTKATYPITNASPMLGLSLNIRPLVPADIGERRVVWNLVRTTFWKNALVPDEDAVQANCGGPHRVNHKSCQYTPNKMRLQPNNNNWIQQMANFLLESGNVRRDQFAGIS